MTAPLKETSVLDPGSGPLVSVAITSFNSEKWLAQALDSVLEQQTTFPVEIVVADDCSKDATVAIAKAYQARYPLIVRVLERTNNIATQRNYYTPFNHSTAKFIPCLNA